jgi:hypothetical protein
MVELYILKVDSSQVPPELYIRIADISQVPPELYIHIADSSQVPPSAASWHHPHDKRKLH